MRQPVGYAYLGGGIGVTNTHRGHRIFVYTRDLGLSPHLIMGGIWEWAIEHAILKLLQPSMTVVEVGCNMGYHTLAMADAIGPKGSIYGFEANPELYKLLYWSMAHNGFMPRARLFNHAVTQEPGRVQFTFTPEAVGGGNVVHGSPAPGANVIEVDGKPLDETLAGTPSIDLLRMDAEGFEPFVIRGARKLIERSPHLRLVVEWSVEMMGARTGVPAFVRELADHGFNASVITGDSKFEPVEMSALVNLPHCEIALSRDSLSNL